MPKRHDGAVSSLNMPALPLDIAVACEDWPLARPFAIARGTKTVAQSVVATAKHGGYCGRGEGIAYPRYGESPESVRSQAMAWAHELASQRSAQAAQAWLVQHAAPGAARQALDCALWDLRAKQAHARVWQLLDLAVPRVVPTAVTLGLAAPSVMKTQAQGHPNAPLFKLKLDGNNPVACVQAVREAVPTAELIADVNEGWTVEACQQWLSDMARSRVACLEQPIAAQLGAALPRPVGEMVLCADEAFHTFDDWPRLQAMYAAVNLKLDKVGGLTAALLLVQKLREFEVPFMLGCMVSSSLSIAPALLLAEQARWIDLDGPSWLAHDRAGGFACGDGFVRLTAVDRDDDTSLAWSAELWG